MCVCVCARTRAQMLRATTCQCSTIIYMAICRQYHTTDGEVKHSGVREGGGGLCTVLANDCHWSSMLIWL